MAEYIDREKLMNDLHNHYECRNAKQNAIMDEVCMIAFKQPTEDVQKVKHGYWEDDEYMYICNICGKWLDITQGTADMNYCPNCGAKMDGDAE